MLDKKRLLSEILRKKKKNRGDCIDPPPIPKNRSEDIWAKLHPDFGEYRFFKDAAMSMNDEKDGWGTRYSAKEIYHLIMSASMKKDTFDLNKFQKEMLSELKFHSINGFEKLKDIWRDEEFKIENCHNGYEWIETIDSDGNIRIKKVPRRYK